MMFINSRSRDFVSTLAVRGFRTALEGFYNAISLAVGFSRSFSSEVKTAPIFNEVAL